MLHDNVTSANPRDERKLGTLDVLINIIFSIPKIRIRYNVLSFKDKIRESLEVRIFFMILNFFVFFAFL